MDDGRDTRSISAGLGKEDQRSFNLILLIGTLTTTVNVVDRSIISILAEPIKRDIGFSDTQLGILAGFAFSMMYSLTGLPIARFVDRPRTNRPAVIAAS